MSTWSRRIWAMMIAAVTALFGAASASAGPRPAVYFVDASDNYASVRDPHTLQESARTPQHTVWLVLVRG
ncbi:hypothetical protein [Kitasatospora viridis]|uniref:Uncharacterized protein n=1 Tax=Kitasatospora viridis TaxID=281105 RepID=A0A561UBE2_9ACTN|nr:hypothetical protein [Kitasatospora viridis]TWF96674.1 hypothetical protein FHX73_11446 [Kitasatospora viridis]